VKTWYLLGRELGEDGEAQVSSTNLKGRKLDEKRTKDSRSNLGPPGMAMLRALAV